MYGVWYGKGDSGGKSNETMHFLERGVSPLPTSRAQHVRPVRLAYVICFIVPLVTPFSNPDIRFPQGKNTVKHYSIIRTLLRNGSCIGNLRENRGAQPSCGGTREEL